MTLASRAVFIRLTPGGVSMTPAPRAVFIRLAPRGVSMTPAPWAVFMTHAFVAVIHDARFAGFAKPHRIAFETLPVLSELPVTKTQNAS